MTSTPITIPPECVLLHQAYKHSGITAADLAIATGKKIGTIRDALNGYRCRGEGIRRPVNLTDDFVVKLAEALPVSPDELRDAGRNYAADVLEAAIQAAIPPDEHDMHVTAAARAHMAQQILTAFSSEELAAELARRDKIAASQEQCTDKKTVS